MQGITSVHIGNRSLGRAFDGHVDTRQGFSVFILYNSPDLFILRGDGDRTGKDEDPFVPDFVADILPVQDRIQDLRERFIRQIDRYLPVKIHIFRIDKKRITALLFYRFDRLFDRHVPQNERDLGMLGKSGKSRLWRESNRRKA